MDETMNSRNVNEAVYDLRRILDSNPDAPSMSGQVGINRCASKQFLTRMSFGSPAVMVPVVGTKTVVVEEREFICKPGRLLLLPDGISFDVVNAPDRRAERYLGLAVRFDAETIELFRQLYAKQFENWDLTPRWQVAGSAKLIAAVANWISWMQQFPTNTTQVRHRMIELLLLFAQQGYAGNLILKQHQSWRLRLKELFLLDPARSWRMAEVCKRLGVSESTLRRYLRVEHIGFRDLLEEVRLELGMGLVMESDMLISQVSLACGYSSQSRFSERFKLRFSMSPTELRNTRTRLPNLGNIVAIPRTVSNNS